MSMRARRTGSKFEDLILLYTLTFYNILEKKGGGGTLPYKGALDALLGM
jgi:hypothetical protein